MTQNPRFEIVEVHHEFVLICDLGPWDEHYTITNRPEPVVIAMLPILNGRRLEYLDSEGERSQLLIVDGRFAGYAPAKIPSPN